MALPPHIRRWPEACRRLGLLGEPFARALLVQVEEARAAALMEKAHGWLGEDTLTAAVIMQMLPARRAMTWDERVARYAAYAQARRFPPWLSMAGNCAYGYWVIGNNYRVASGYHGGYPPTYLKRLRVLFADKQRVLHLFSGKVDLTAFPGDTVDINPALNPTFVDDAQMLERVPLEKYDLALADPPYSGEDAEHYGRPMVNRNRVLRALERLPLGAHLVWLDQVQPMYRKAAFRQEAGIAIQRSTNHRVRSAFIWCRHDEL